MSAASAVILNAVIARARNSLLTMQIFSGKFSRAAASQLINNHMLRIFHVIDQVQLDRIRAWSAVADHRCQLIRSEIAGQVQYRAVVESRSYEADHAELFAAEFAEAVTETEFPVQHPAPINTP